MSPEEIDAGYEWETANGPSGKKAVENALALEIVAEMALKTLQLNSKASSPLVASATTFISFWLLKIVINPSRTTG
jgi:hypothetical protein